MRRLRTGGGSGEKKARTEWHRVVIFGGLAGVAERSLRKGSKVLLVGKQQTRKWQGQDGADRYTTEIVMDQFRSELVLLDRPNGGPSHDPGDGGGGRAAGRGSMSSRWPAPAGGSTGGPAGKGYAGPGSSLDDGIPFAPCVL